MANLTKPERAALDQIAQLTDPDRLRRLLANARRLGSEAVEAAAFRRLCTIQPAAATGTLEHDVWASVHALEQMLRDERGKTVRLSRTRQKIARDGEARTVADLTLKPEPADGFHQLIALGHPELLFEAVVLRHPDQFETNVVEAARQRLSSAGIDPEKLISEGSSPNG